VRYFLSLLGMVMVIEGIPYFISPGRMKKFLARVSEFTDSSLRIYGMIIIICGLILAWCAGL